jgi:NADPH:quinone reductase-like Zn-dependent oxidoreductase
MNFNFLPLATLCFGFTTWSTCTAIANESIPFPAAHNEISSTKLKGKTIVITGASSGLGRGTALRLAAQGANLVIASRRIEVLEELARQCGPNTIAVKTDVSSADDVVNLAKAAVTKFGRIYV